MKITKKTDGKIDEKIDEFERMADGYCQHLSTYDNFYYFTIISTSIIYECQLLFINFITPIIIYELYVNFYYYDNTSII